MGHAAFLSEHLISRSRVLSTGARPAAVSGASRSRRGCGHEPRARPARREFMGPGCSFREVIMGIRGRSVLLFALVLSGAGQALAQDAARAAVERAIEAHGGMRRLSQ